MSDVIHKVVKGHSGSPVILCGAQAKRAKFKWAEVTCKACEEAERERVREAAREAQQRRNERNKSA